MHKAVKYLIVAVVLIAGLYSMKVAPMDGALVCAGVIAVYVLLDKLVFAESDCSCEYSPEHGIEDFESTTSHASHTAPALIPGSVKVFDGTGNRFDIKNGAAVQVAPSGMVAITAPAVPADNRPVPHTAGVDSFGKETTGDLGYSQVPINAMINSSERVEQKPRSVFGEVYVDPEAWHPPCLRAPICSTSSGCPVQPVFLNSNYIDLLSWDDSRRITPPDSIDSEYITKVLNSGAASAPIPIPTK